MANLFLSNLKHRWFLAVVFIVVIIALALIFSLLQTPQYQASTQVLIIQKISQDIDAYSAVKSAEKIAKNLQSIILSSTFQSRVLNSKSEIKDDFGSDEQKRRQKWEKMISTEILSETSILKIDVYHQDPTQAANIAKTIAYVLETQGQEYHGGPESVQIKTIDEVLVSKKPVKPNLVLNIGAAIILSLAVSLIYIYLTAQPKLSPIKINRTNKF